MHRCPQNFMAALQWAVGTPSAQDAPAPAKAAPELPKVSLPGTGCRQGMPLPGQGSVAENIVQARSGSTEGMVELPGGSFLMGNVDEDAWAEVPSPPHPQVNLLPSDSPQDVYAGVRSLVAQRVAEDAAGDGPDADIATKLNGLITRKVVKQTVMTDIFEMANFRPVVQQRTPLK